MDQRPEFGDSFLVGIEQIDREHRRPFDIAGRAYDCLGAGGAVDHAGLRATVAELIDYTATHFANEEGLMAAAGYPELAAHREQHRHLMSRVGDMEMRVEIGDAAVALDLTQFLYRWLVEHIESSDHRFGEFARAQQAS